MRLVQGRLPCRRYSYDVCPYICSIPDFGNYSHDGPVFGSCSTADCNERISCAPPPLQRLYSYLPNDLPCNTRRRQFSGLVTSLWLQTCLSLLGGSRKVPGGSPGFFLLSHACKLVIRVSIFQFSQVSSVRTILGPTCGSLLRVDITNPQECPLPPL